ncbi:MAG: Imm63 family immunity protein [Planctomycetota bacterium]
MSELDKIAKRYYEIAEALNATKQSRQFRIAPSYDGSRHSEYDGLTFKLITSERGEFTDAQSTENPNELLFWLVRDLTAAMALEYELANRPNGFDGDTRRTWFAKHVELLRQIDNTWAERQQAEYNKILPDTEGEAWQTDAHDTRLAFVYFEAMIGLQAGLDETVAAWWKAKGIDDELKCISFFKQFRQWAQEG